MIESQTKLQGRGERPTLRPLAIEPTAPRRQFSTLLVSLALHAGPAAADPLALWRIVHEQCASHQESGEGPKPCEAVDLSGGPQAGVAILKDLRGVAQMLAIPTRRITGIEDPQILAPDAPDLFAAAWKAKPLVDARLPRALRREAVAIAINSEARRSQEQLHLHIDCLSKNVADALARYRGPLDENWRQMTVPLSGRAYYARRLDSADLVGARPLKLLADGLPEAQAHMGEFSLAAVGAVFGGKPGFILLADRASAEGGGHAEDLEDHDCAIAQSTP
jgi:CDP-diacylglycerol pyrophosphatase